MTKKQGGPEGREWREDRGGEMGEKGLRIRIDGPGRYFVNGIRWKREALQLLLSVQKESPTQRYLAGVSQEDAMNLTGQFMDARRYDQGS